MDDGNLLVLTETPNGVDVEITENLKPDSRTNLKNLVTLVKHLTGNSSDVREEYSETNGLKVTMHVPNIDEKICKQSIEQIHRNISVGLIKKMEDIEKQRRADVNRLVYDIKHYKNMPLDLGYLDKLKEEEIRSNFTRELLDIISTKIRTKKFPKGVPIYEILGNKWSGGISVAREIGMYVIRKALKLSTPEIGKIFGYVGQPKNHTTVV